MFTRVEDHHKVPISEVLGLSIKKNGVPVKPPLDFDLQICIVKHYIT